MEFGEASMKVGWRLSTILFGGFATLIVAVIAVQLPHMLSRLQSVERLPEVLTIIVFILCGIVAAFALLMAVWLLVFKPLAELRSATRAIAQGHLDVRVRRPILPELAEVADAVNLMLDQLVRQRQDMTETNLRLEEMVAARTYELASRNAELVALHTISQITLAHKSIDTAAQAVSDAVSAATNFPFITIEHFDIGREQAVWQGASQDAKAVLHRAMQPAQVQDSVYNLPAECSMLRRVSQPNDIVIFNEQPSQGEAASWMRLFGCRTCLCAPITSGQRVIGALTLGHPLPDKPTAWLANWVRTLGAHVGPLLEFLQAQEDLLHTEQALSKRDAILDAVGFAAEQFLRTHDWDVALPGVLQRLGEAADAGRVYIIENHPDADGQVRTSKHAEWVAVHPLPTAANDASCFLSYDAQGFGRWADQLSRERNVKGIVKTFPEQEREFLQVSGIRSVLVVPIFVDKQWWGFVGFDDCKAEREWSAAEEEALTAAARIMGAAIQNAQLIDSIHQLAMTDSLTGLYNRRHFFDVAAVAFDAARMAGESLSVIMLDADDLKMVNDAFGHQAGDHLLQVLASRLRLLLRNEDILARYGGDEFAILLPGTALPDAQVIASRLMNEVKATPLIDVAAYRRGVVTTVSVGLAVGDYRCPDFKTLLNRADQALYAAKQAGKGRLRIWQPSQFFSA